MRIWVRLHGSCAWASRIVNFDFVSVSSEHFMQQTLPNSWRMVLLDMNSDIYDSSKKFVIGSVNDSDLNTGETIQQWKTVSEDGGAAGRVVE